MYIDLGGSQAASKNSKSSIQVIQHFLINIYQSSYFIAFLYIVNDLHTYKLYLSVSVKIF